MLPHLAAAMAPGVLLLILALLPRGGVGTGDGLCLLLCGLVWEARWCWEALLLGLTCGGVYALGLLALRKGTRKTRFPFLPFLAAGYGLTLLHRSLLF